MMHDIERRQSGTRSQTWFGAAESGHGVLYPVGSDVIGRIRAAFGEKWVREEQPRELFVAELFARAEKSIHVAAGGVGRFFAADGPLDVLEGALQRAKPVQARFVLSPAPHRGVVTLEHAKDLLDRTNPRLAQLAATYPGDLQVSWCSRPLAIHFITVDTRYVMVEKKNHPVDSLPPAVFKHDATVASRLQNLFDVIIADESTRLISNGTPR